MRYLICCIVTLFTLNGFAQQDPQQSTYFFNPLQFNSAYAGSLDGLNITSVSRIQYLGWDGGPKTQFLSAHVPIARKRIGIGGNLFYDKSGARNSFNAIGNFSFHMQLNKDNLRMSLGLSAGIQQDSYNFSGLVVNDKSDPNYLSSNTSIAPNFGFGIYIYNKKFYSGLSVPKLLKNSIDNKTGNSFIQQHMYLLSGWVVPINSVIDLKPSALIKITANAPLTTDLNLSAFFYKKVWVGIMYRFNESVGFNSTYQLDNNLMIGYAFDYPINGMRLNQTGNHELVLSMNITSKKNAFISPRYF